MEQSLSTWSIVNVTLRSQAVNNYMALFDSSGTLIAKDDSRRTTGSSTVVIRRAIQGTFKIEIRPIPADVYASFVLIIETTSVTESSAAIWHGASKWHAQGIKGLGKKVGVIDKSFEAFSAFQEPDRDLPPDSSVNQRVFARCYSGVCSFDDTGTPQENLQSFCERALSLSIPNPHDIHGTGVAEAVYRIATDACATDPQGLRMWMSVRSNAAA